MPGRLEIGTGEIAAANGDVSPQMDLIVYDRLHTPLLDGTDSSILVPVEGVYAVIEVASNLSSSKLKEDAEKIRKAKRLRKVGYFQPGETFIKKTVTMWGAEHDHFPVLGFCFGYEGAETDGLRSTVEGLDAAWGIAESVDMACVLTRGCVMNGEPDPGVPVGTLPYRELSACPTPRTARLSTWANPDDPAGLALMHFYLLAGGMLAQAEAEPISMAPYLGA